MNNLLEQWNEHIVRGNQLSRELEDFEGIIGAGQDPTSEIAFVERGIGTTYISVLPTEKMLEFKHMILNAINDAKEEKEIEIKKLMGLVPVMPALPNGAKVLIVGEGRPIPHLLLPDAPEVVIPNPITRRKAATINPEFEAAVQDMIQSVKKAPDPGEEKLTNILDKQAKEIKSKPIAPTEKSLDKYPPAKKKSSLPEAMSEEAVRRLYQDEGKTIKQIADHFGVKPSTVNNFIYLRGLKRSSKKSPTEKERP